MFPLLAVLIPYVVSLTGIQYAHVPQAISEDHRNVGPNVLSTPSVLLIWLVSIISVQILALDRVEHMPNVA